MVLVPAVAVGAVGTPVSDGEAKLAFKFKAFCVAVEIIKFTGSIFPFLKNQRPIEGEKVAKAMIHSANEQDVERIKIYELDEIFELAEK